MGLEIGEHDPEAHVGHVRPEGVAAVILRRPRWREPVIEVPIWSGASALALGHHRDDHQADRGGEGGRDVANLVRWVGFGRTASAQLAGHSFRHTGIGRTAFSSVWLSVKHAYGITGIRISVSKSLRFGATSSATNTK